MRCAMPSIAPAAPRRAAMPHRARERPRRPACPCAPRSPAPSPPPGRSVGKASVRGGSALLLAAHVVVILPLVPAHIIHVAGRRIARRIVGAGAARQTDYRKIDAAVEEEGNGVALAARAVDNAMRRREEAVIRPAPQHVAAIDEERSEEHTSE